jgi:hypothetical protein
MGFVPFFIFRGESYKQNSAYMIYINDIQRQQVRCGA